jgi:hypothetical protein
MTDNPITKKITRHVRGYWRGYAGLNGHHPNRWTIGMLQQVVDDVRAAGYGDDTELTPKISRDPTGLEAFELSRTEQIADEVVERVTPS